MNFAHLQISTAYSLLSSTISIPALIDQAQKLDYKALAITDHNVLYGVLPFYKQCLKAKIKPIIGMTAFIKLDESAACPFILLAKNNHGYENLLKISSVIKTTREESIILEDFISYTSGLIALTPGKNGRIEQLLLQDQKDQAIVIAKQFLNIFGKDHFYLSVQQHHNDMKLLTSIKELASNLDIPLVATNNVQYLEKDDSFARDCLIAIRDGVKNIRELVTEEDHQDYYFKSQKEMVDLFIDLPDAIANTLKIAEECNVMIETGRELLPKYPLSEGEKSSHVLSELCKRGLIEKISNPDQKYWDRLAYELKIINQMGFNDYFLIVWDFMKYARDHNILTGPGRGSAAGALVSFLLGITDVDPIKHGLLFERFLNPERVSMPDIDIDFPDHRRDEVIQYVMNKYGRENVAQIITFGTFAAKAALRDTARVFGLNSEQMEKLSKLVPSRLGITLKQAFQESDGLKDFINQSDHNRKLFETALKIEGLPRHTSTHAAGVVISERPLTNYIALQGGETGTYLTQFPMENLEEIGLLKMDFLGLRNLTLLEQIQKSIELRTRKKINIKEIPFQDQKTFNLLQQGETSGIFQLESEGMRKVLRDLKPTEFEDIVAVNALFRPGPMENIPLYIARKQGVQKVQYPHPDLHDILSLTYGVIVYQEQIIQIASKMAGFSLGEADLLRRAVSKKKRDVLDEERKHFVEGALGKGYDKETAHEIYDLIVRFANYGFNRSHAVAYSFISWQLAWLKANYQEDFMAALLTSVIGNEEKLSKYIAEAKQNGINILPPSINASHFPFISDAKGIRFSLGAIKGIGAAVLREIIQARKRGPFQDLFDFCIRVSPRTINRKVIESLIHSGAFDEFGYDRAVLLATLDVALDHAEFMRPTNELDLFIDEFQVKPKYVKVEPIAIVDKLFYEKQVLGLYISDHPTSVFTEKFRALGTKSLHELKSGERNVIAGVYFINLKKIRTKKGELMAFVKMSDSSGDMEGVIFPDVFRKYGAHCKEGETVLVSGNIEQRGEITQFIIQRIQSPEEISIPKRPTLYIKIPTELHHQKILYQLQGIFQAHPGSTMTVLHYEKTSQTIRLGSKDWVNVSKTTLTELQNLLGKENVVLK
ncbi:DNA polymerase III subunit alpha [Bacillus niameyensis]|uniref:DNA polymerase III subunit alpha n=1 Tax=Bacillus niameyensis TaxID=1522308 RepID=UPI000781DBF4|nr:DNA polymerase III subunit alpha [Bacillus niameyensis]